MSTFEPVLKCAKWSRPQTGGQTARQEARRLSSWLLQACKPVIIPLQTARLHHSLAPRKTRLMRNPAVDDFCLLRQKLLQDSNQALLGRRGVIRDIWNVRGSIKTDFPSCQLLRRPALNPEKLVWNQDQKLAGFQMNTRGQSQNILTTLVSPSQDFRL